MSQSRYARPQIISQRQLEPPPKTISIGVNQTPSEHDRLQNEVCIEICTKLLARIEQIENHQHVVPNGLNIITKTDMIQYAIMLVLILVIIVLISRK